MGSSHFNPRCCQTSAWVALSSAGFEGSARSVSLLPGSCQQRLNFCYNFGISCDLDFPFPWSLMGLSILSSVYWPVMFPAYDVPLELFCSFLYGIALFILMWISFLYMKATHSIISYLCCRYPFCSCLFSSLPQWCVGMKRSSLCNPGQVIDISLRFFLHIPLPSAVWSAFQLLGSGSYSLIWPALCSAVLLHQNTKLHNSLPPFQISVKVETQFQLPPPAGSCLRLPQQNEWILSLPPFFLLWHLVYCL